MATDFITSEVAPPTLGRRRRVRYVGLGLVLAAASAALASLILLPGERDQSLWLERVRFLEKVRQNGGEVFYTHDAHAYSRLSDWLYWKTRLRLPGTPSSPHVRGSEHIARLCLVGATITDGDMRFVESFTRLQELTVKQTAIDDEGLRHLSALNGITNLILEGPFTDVGLQHLTGLEDLGQLQLIGARVERSGFSHLKVLPLLWNLSLQQGVVTEEALEPIGSLTSLTQLSLSGSRVTDAAIAHVGRAQNLRHLQLSGTLVSDRGLVHLSGMTNLQSLSLHNTRVTSSGVRSLKRALPKLRVYE